MSILVRTLALPTFFTHGLSWSIFETLLVYNAFQWAQCSRDYLPSHEVPAIQRSLRGRSQKELERYLNYQSTANSNTIWAIVPLYILHNITQTAIWWKKLEQSLKNQCILLLSNWIIFLNNWYQKDLARIWTNYQSRHMIRQ